MTAKRKSAKKGAEAEPKPARTFPELTLFHISYHPEAKLLRANVQQDVEFAGSPHRQGRDIDIAFDDLSDEVRTALEDAFKWVAEDVKAVPFEAEE